MRVKNHMAIWFLWFLWFLRVECSLNPLYKPFCAFFGLCGSFVVLVWVVLWFLVTCGFLALVCASYCSLWFLWVGGLALDANSDACASSCSLWFLRFGGLAIDARCRRLRVLLLFVDC